VSRGEGRIAAFPPSSAGGCSSSDPATAPLRPVWFKRARLERLREIERWHFWFAGRRELIARLLREYAAAAGAVGLDLGCGTGGALPDLERDGRRVLGLDLRPEGLAATRQQRPACWLVQADADRLPLGEATVDVITALDVLEHVDDRAALAEIRRVLRPGGVAIITVPAMKWLWSYRDEDAGHRRRYGRRELQTRLAESGLAVVWLNHYQVFLLPLVALTRGLGRRGPALRDLEERRLPLLNGLLRSINRLEAWLSHRVSWPAGSSLVAVCKRSDS
jgi:SAM-dependent methyltransferase